MYTVNPKLLVIKLQNEPKALLLVGFSICISWYLVVFLCKLFSQIFILTLAIDVTKVSVVVDIFFWLLHGYTDTLILTLCLLLKYPGS